MRLPAALDGLHGLLQRLQEAGAVLSGEAGVMALALAGLAQVAGEIAHRQRHADAGLGEGLAGVRAPALRQRAASGMSAVTTMSPLPARAAIQSSAASGPSATTTRSTSDPSGRRM